MNVIEIMEIFNLGLIGKVIFIITSFTIGLKRPVHQGFGV